MEYENKERAAMVALCVGSNTKNTQHSRVWDIRLHGLTALLSRDNSALGKEGPGDVKSFIHHPSPNRLFRIDRTCVPDSLIALLCDSGAPWPRHMPSPLCVNVFNMVNVSNFSSLFPIPPPKFSRGDLARSIRAVRSLILRPLSICPLSIPRLGR